jgi:hypothetical protein
MLRHKWEESEKVQSKFHFIRDSIAEVENEAEYDIIEEILVEELEELMKNYTVLNMYTRTMMVTLKLVLQSGYGAETSNSIYNMLMTTVSIKTYYKLT